MRERPDGQLVAAAREGDSESFVELYRRYYPAAVGIVISGCRIGTWLRMLPKKRLRSPAET
jgi:hypothetical protein